MTAESIVQYPQIEVKLSGEELAVLYACAREDRVQQLIAEGGPIWLALESAGESGNNPNLAELSKRASVPAQLDFGTASSLAEVLRRGLSALCPEWQIVAQSLSRQLVELLPRLHATTEPV